MNGILTSDQIQSVWAGEKPKGSLNKNSKYQILCIYLFGLCIFYEAFFMAKIEIA